MLSAPTVWHKKVFLNTCIYQYIQYQYFSSPLEAPFPIMSLSSLRDINSPGIVYYFFLLL